MKTINEAMEKMKDAFTGKCNVCGRVYAYNVCIVCDAKVTARKAYKKYYTNCIWVDSMRVPDVIKYRDKEFYKKEAISYCQNGLQGLSEDEKVKFKMYFDNEFDRLRNIDYMCKVLHFNASKECFIDNQGKWFDELKEFNRRTVNR